SYKLVFQKWPASDLADRARLMAGHCAFNRQDWKSAIDLFTNLTSNPGGELWAEAVSAYGDTLVARGSTNKVADYLLAIKVFNVLCESKTTNPQTPLAWGQLASCYLQWALASGEPDALTNAI